MILQRIYIYGWRYIAEVIHADFDDRSAKEILSLPKRENVGYARPLDPRQHPADFAQVARDEELSIARTVQIHTCTQERCMTLKKGKMVCKRRAPWKESSHAWVDANGDWGPKRAWGRVNNWNKYIALALHANHDVKIITNGALADHITWYICAYAIKNQLRSHNLSVFLGRNMDYQRALAHSTGVRPSNQKLLQSCANTLNRHRELSAPDVVNLLMGWGDRLLSHNYVSIYWFKVVSALKREFPHLRVHQ